MNRPSTAANTSQISEVLETAQALLPQYDDEHLAHKAAALSGYLTLSRMYPERNYDAILTKTLADLKNALQCHPME